MSDKHYKVLHLSLFTGKCTFLANSEPIQIIWFEFSFVVIQTKQ